MTEERLNEIRRINAMYNIQTRKMMEECLAEIDRLRTVGARLRAADGTECMVVPVAPTHLMRTEGNHAFEDAGTQWNGRKEVPEWDASVKAWRAMIAVAKEPGHD